MDISTLYAKVENLLKESGFPPEHYVLKREAECVVIMFDKKGAVDYFKGDFDNSDLADDCLFEYKRVGKKHAAYIYNW
jgi:hypothetical protein